MTETRLRKVTPTKLEKARFEREEAKGKFTALENRIKREIDHLRAKAKRNAARSHSEQADRLQAILDAEYERKEWIPDAR